MKIRNSILIGILYQQEWVVIEYPIGLINEVYNEFRDGDDDVLV